MLKELINTKQQCKGSQVRWSLQLKTKNIQATKKQSTTKKQKIFLNDKTPQNTNQRTNLWKKKNEVQDRFDRQVEKKRRGSPCNDYEGAN